MKDLDKENSFCEVFWLQVFSSPCRVRAMKDAMSFSFLKTNFFLFKAKKIVNTTPNLYSLLGGCS